MLTKKKGANSFLSTREAAKYLGMSRSWLLDHMEEIGYYRLRGKFMFKKGDLDRYLKKVYQKPKDTYEEPEMYPVNIRSRKKGKDPDPHGLLKPLRKRRSLGLIKKIHPVKVSRPKVR